MRPVSSLLRACAILALFSAAAPATTRVQLEGSAGLVTDYRYRGISLSEGRPAAQGELELTAGDWFAGGWVSTTKEQADRGAELDLYAGRQGSFGSFHYTVSGYYYADSRRGVTNYAEAQAVISRRIGHVELEFEAAFAPGQAHLDNSDAYLAAGMSVPLKARILSLSAHAGYEDGSWHRKLDWDVGADYRHAAFHLGAHLIGVACAHCRSSAGHRGRTALVGSARVEL